MPAKTTDVGCHTDSPNKTLNTWPIWPNDRNTSDTSGDNDDKDNLNGKSDDQRTIS